MDESDSRQLLDAMLDHYRLNEDAAPLEQRLEKLGDRLGYAGRTLRGVYYGEPMSQKLRNWITKKLSEDPNLKARIVSSGNGRETVLLERSPPPGQSQSQSQSGDVVNLMAELLTDLETASPLKKRWLADQIHELSLQLKASLNADSKPN